MTCKHEHIQTWRHEDGQPAMWSCVDCAAKFEPIKGWMDQVERKDALLRQALEVLELARSYCGVGHVEAACDKSTEAIKQELSQ